ncbi:MAG TPA: tripartite tricarboxylate transporter permease [Xanthobacteraceae bacterium]|nr:tripartite tricarboxylate transporter permease [Xanthobacteraceae bacterium]
MDIIGNLGLGFSVALEPSRLLYCFIGTLVGTLIGVLPGIGPTATIAMLLPLTFTLDPLSALIMMAGIYYGAQYGGSTTAILINLPGESSSAVTAIDGYQMARQGKAGAALATAALGSFFAGTVATLIVALAAPPLSAVALRFGPPEYFSLMILGLIASVILASGSVPKALAMVVLGILLGLVGMDRQTAVSRFTLGYYELADGIEIISIAVGMFGMTEILKNLENETTRQAMAKRVSNLMLSLAEIKQIAAPVLRGTAIGSALGVLPGGGAVLSSFAAYMVEKKISKSPERFGHGAIEGVAAPESANNAAAQTSFIPMLTLGLPINAVSALMIGAMIMQGMIPGPNIVVEQAPLFWGIIVSMWIGNLMLVLLNLPMIGLWVRLLSVPYYVLFPAILTFSAVGVYSVNANPFDLYFIAVFGALGYALIKLGCEPVPLILGFVLGPMLEDQLRRSMILSRGSVMIFIERPISLGFIIVTLAVLALILLPSVVSKREQVFVEED